MNPRLWNWILAGALAGSLALHARTWTRTGTEPRAPACAPAPCALDLTGLELSSEQEERLAALCAPETCSVDGVPGETSVHCASLLESLADASTDEQDLRERARQLGAVQARELERCVETILAVRKVLTPQQVQALLESCCARGGT